MKRIRIFAALWLLAALFRPAAAERLILPENLRRLEPGAFAGDSALTGAVLGEAIAYIGAEAFSSCGALRWVIVKNRNGPTVGEGAFPDTAALYAAGDTRTSLSGKGGYFPNFRALLVGQTYKDALGKDTLPGCDRDAETLGELLGSMEMTPYSSPVVQVNGSVSDAEEAIAALAAAASENDVTLFYFSGHGGLGGSLVFAAEGEWVRRTPAWLRTQLDTVPGRKIVLIDACYSGGMIGRGKETAAEFTEGFLSAFLGGASSRGENAFDNEEEEYAVLAACRGSELSSSVLFGEEGDDYFGLFTGVLECAMGETGRMAFWYRYYPDTLVQNEEHPDALPGDADGDTLITLAEAYAYVLEGTRRFAQSWNAEVEDSDNKISQTVQVWPEDSEAVLFGT